MNLFDKFFSFSLPKVYDAKTLAVELAKRTRFLKDEVVTEELKERRNENDLWLNLTLFFGRSIQALTWRITFDE